LVLGTTRIVNARANPSCKIKGGIGGAYFIADSVKEVVA